MPIFQMREIRAKGIKYLAQGNRAAVVAKLEIKSRTKAFRV